MDVVSQPRLYNIESVTNVKATKSDQLLKIILNTEVSKISFFQRSYKVFSYNCALNSWELRKVVKIQENDQESLYLEVNWERKPEYKYLAELAPNMCLIENMGRYVMTFKFLIVARVYFHEYLAYLKLSIRKLLDWWGILATKITNPKTFLYTNKRHSYLKKKKKEKDRLYIVVHAFPQCLWDKDRHTTEFGQHSMLLASQNYTVRPFLKKAKPKVKKLNGMSF